MFYNTVRSFKGSTVWTGDERMHTHTLNQRSLQLEVGDHLVQASPVSNEVFRALAEGWRALFVLRRLLPGTQPETT